MPRRLFSLVALASLLLCVLTLAWWARSYLSADLNVGAADGRLILLFSDPPLTRFWLKESPVGNGSEVSAATAWARARRGQLLRQVLYGATPGVPGGFTMLNLPQQSSSFAGVFHITEPVGPGDATYHLIAVPLPYLALLLAIPPVAWLVTTLRRRGRARAGCCARCGYDLRATPGRCPECGAEARAEPGTMAAA
jgi:hypothetical protein